MARGNNATTLYDYRHECRQRELDELSDMFHATYKPRFYSCRGGGGMGIIYQESHNYFDVGRIVKDY